ncbi:hypothetical protein MASR2M74_33120 [Paracoccaceae bacterium]
MILARLPTVVSALALLAACVPADPNTAARSLPANSRECPVGAGAGCYFRNSPVQLQPKKVEIAGRPYAFQPTARSLEFFDGEGRGWTAPSGTLTDGASIPQIFVPVVGDPRSREFANAAAMHDAWCGIGNEDGAVYHKATWQEVHRMFYDSLIVGGTDDLRAKVMFAAVWLGGPRWAPVSGAPDSRLERLPVELRRDGMRRAKAYIERENPPISRLIPYLGEIERDMFAAVERDGSALDEYESPNEGEGRGIEYPVTPVSAM